MKWQRMKAGSVVEYNKEESLNEKFGEIVRGGG